MIRGSNVKRIMPRSGTSVRSTVCATTMAPPVRAGLTSARARRRALIAKRHPPVGGCRRGYPVARDGFALGRRDQVGVFRVDGLHDLLGDQQVRRAARVEAVNA